MPKSYWRKMISGIFYFFSGIYLTWMVMGGLPTGWLYDLGVGTGTEQGQWPDENVAIVERQEELEPYLKENVPVTVVGNNLILCPLMRLRDSDEQGEHYTDITTKYTTMTEEYESFSFPVTFLRKAINMLTYCASYNSYYLIQIQDGSYLCVYFDDYLMLQRLFRDELHFSTGRIRYSTNYERVMLSGMYYKEGCCVNDLFVLDMYRHEKVNWVVDKLLRCAAAMIPVIIGFYVKDWIEKKQENAA